MTDLPTLYRQPAPALAQRQRATATLRIGKRTRAKMTVETTPAGLLAVGGLVSAILLSTAVLVGVAVRAPGQGGSRGAIGPHI